MSKIDETHAGASLSELPLSPLLTENCPPRPAVHALTGAEAATRELIKSTSHSLFLSKDFVFAARTQASPIACARL